MTMGKHGAARLPVRELRGSYIRLLETYGRLLREHRRLEAEHRELLQRMPPAPPSTEVELWRPVQPVVWGQAREAMDVEAAREWVRSSGLLTSPGA
jgi:hypothetical protein